MGRLLVVAVLLVGCVLWCGTDALRCYWCVGTHCLHAGSGEQIDCDGSCYTMSAELPDGLSLSLSLSACVCVCVCVT